MGQLTNHAREVRQSLLTRFWANVKKTDIAPAHRPDLGGCWLWTGWKSPTGYGSIHSGGRRAAGRQKRTHRVSWELHYGDIPDGACVLHRCDNRACVRPDHLFIGSQQENIEDMRQKGRARAKFQQGQAHAMATLNDDDVARMRIMAREGAWASDIAKEFGVTTAIASNAIRGKTWSHIPGAVNRPQKRPRGSAHGGSKLTESLVLEMRSLLADGLSRREAAALFGVSVSLVAQIARREVWRHV